MAAISSPDLRPSTVFQCQLVSSDGKGATGQILTDKLESEHISQASASVLSRDYLKIRMFS